MRLRVIIAALAAAAASACSHMPDVSRVIPNDVTPVRATPDLAPRERVRMAVELLGRGEAPRAEAELEAALRDQPNMSSARRLLDQINREPREMLAGSPAPYTVRQGETMSVLAERFQGDALLFYALARYNDLAAPNELAAGQTLMIPRRPGVRVTEVATSAPLAELRQTTPSAPPGAPPTPRGLDPSRANQLRLQGLQLLNAGQVDRAVGVLRQAQSLDAHNAMIQRDLDRALRLQTSLRSSGGSR